LAVSPTAAAATIAGLAVGLADANHYVSTGERRPMTRAEYAKAHLSARSKTARLVIDGKRKIRQEYLRITAGIAKVVRENRFKPFLEEQIRAAFPRVDLHKFLMGTVVNGRVTIARNVAAIDKQYLFDALDSVPGHGLSKEKIAAMFEAKADRMRITNSRPYLDLVKNAGGKKYTDGGEEVRFDYTFHKSYSLSKSVWDTVNHTEEDILNVVRLGIVEGKDVREVAAGLMEYVKDGPDVIKGRWGKLKPGEKILKGRHWQYATEEARQYAKRLGAAGVDYRAARLYRSEMYRNLQESAVSDGESNPACTGEYDWILMPGRENWPCDCPDIAAAGPYRADNIPPYRHPNCDCTIRPRLKDGDAFIQDLRDYVNGEPGGDGIARWAEGNDLFETGEFIKGEEIPGYKPKKWPTNITFTEIEQEIKTIAGFEMVDLKSIPEIKEAEQIYEVFNKAIVQYPELKGMFKTLNIDKKIHEAFSSALKGTITLGSNFTNGIEYLIKNNALNVREKWWPKSRKWYSSINHEIGHFIDFYLTGVNYRPNEWGNKSNDIMDYVLKELGFTENDIKNNLSGYATQGPNEFLAEAFSEYMDSGNPRPIALMVGNIIKSLLEEMRK
jgi:hypothetical protein